MPPQHAGVGVPRAFALGWGRVSAFHKPAFHKLGQGDGPAAFFLAALGWYGYTFAMQGRLTNMSTLLFSAAVIVFLIGLISEQITNLTYRRDA